MGIGFISSHEIMELKSRNYSKEKGHYMKKSYNWVYGESDCQNYYEVKLGKDYLCVFAHKKYPEVWMGFYIKNGQDVTVMDKTFNDRQRKKDEKNGITSMYDGYLYPRTTKLLGSKDVEFMKRKVIFAYEHELSEVSSR